MQVEHLNIYPETPIFVALPLTAWAWSKELALCLEGYCLPPSAPGCLSASVSLAMPAITALSQVLPSLLGDNGFLVTPHILFCLSLGQSARQHVLSLCLRSC